MSKISLGLIFGGESQEHEVSLQSAKNIYDAIDKNKYDVKLIGVDKKGNWFLFNKNFLENENNPKNIKLKNTGIELGFSLKGKNSKLIDLRTYKEINIDIVFSIIHGTIGEDGALQGMLRILNIPFIGAGILGSAVGMDKEIMKRLLVNAGIKTSKYITIRKYELIDYNKLEETLGYPMFVKPANMGSSVGISKAKNKKELEESIEKAFKYDNKIIIEEFIKGREIECAILEKNGEVLASGIGEIVPNLDKHEFYSYEAKYIDENGANLEIPAKLEKKIVNKVQEIAKEVFKILECKDIARIDSFLCKNGDIYVNEINTLPGFTKISMYPKLWNKEGIAYSELIDILISNNLK
ncbi:D-alanine--D-alanine ligase [Hypnocyclicus thermotrophus]|uniref:D-alanine--D-alanine ligase n=1 Tax=Hypnocyclicus thermotrophus TaxID=1627895 RepID=A0AA46DXF8_9FUSO|nr:D-alanine--D-alanine ligase family protein [Hypnocyclicus thermotrophus]TDT68066.1 D-alanine--D-alanine ligase [Hypnocyclicus thermotrophus]